MVNSDLDPSKAKQDVQPPAETKKKGFWPKFITFLSMGGFLVIIFVVVAFVIGISVAVNSCQGK